MVFDLLMVNGFQVTALDVIEVDPSFSVGVTRAGRNGRDNGRGKFTVWQMLPGPFMDLSKAKKRPPLLAAFSRSF
jgi:hypothetical protein